MNRNDFIPSTLKMYPRNILSAVGTAGTVTAADFEDWMEDYL